MRGIRFRVWDIDKKAFIESFRLIDIATAGFTRRELEAFNFEQYTGLKDKNGIEVCEDDIWLFDGCKYLVQWTERYASFQLVAIDLDTMHRGEVLSLILIGEGEVIGNIYKNPELLK